MQLCVLCKVILKVIVECFDLWLLILAVELRVDCAFEDLYIFLEDGGVLEFVFILFIKDVHVLHHEIS